MTSTLRRLTAADLPRLRQFWIKHWGGEEMLTRGNVYRPKQLDGFVVEDENEWVGLITFLIKDNECEVTSLDSLREGKGIATQLLDKAIQEARAGNCKRLFLITTNDNLHALGFYQKRGFEIVTIYRGAVNESRKIKPTIPLVGMDGIPLRDEIELEVMLKS
ncbi:MAG TPA: GNAT family N-acetyltransferase [Anaerolineales bacterium]|nr:GNAT family N-acetyltransferase [Anaerolineales bacterium]